VSEPLHIDIAIFGGGAAGLWLLDDLHRNGRNTLLFEAHELGSGQTIASQGIIHGGLKYTLSGLLTGPARAISNMPMIWRRCLGGEATPDLAQTRLRAHYCHLWRTATLKSRLAMIGARAGLRITPAKLDFEQRPPPLAHCPGTVARLDEQVIEPASFLYDIFQQHRQRILKIDIASGLEFAWNQPGVIKLIRLIHPESGEAVDIQPQVVVFAAGEGNATLRASVGLDSAAMQRRPLHMVVARGELPVLNGHCIDGSATRATITTTEDSDNRTLWQIGGQIAETGVAMSARELIAFAKDELAQILPGLDLLGTEWTTYRADRAEAAMRGGRRPDNAYAKLHGNSITAWPTKLALVPALSEQVRRMIESTHPHLQPLHIATDMFRDWPRPVVALPPWETAAQWFTDV
jgi:glycerol-3-phosphate dehydrogenase